MKPDKVLKELKKWARARLRFWNRSFADSVKSGREWDKGYDNGSVNQCANVLDKIKQLEDELE